MLTAVDALAFIITTKSNSNDVNCREDDFKIEVILIFMMVPFYIKVSFHIKNKSLSIIYHCICLLLMKIVGNKLRCKFEKVYFCFWFI